MNTIVDNACFQDNMGYKDFKDFPRGRTSDVFVEKFIRTFSNKIDKYMTSISKNVYIDKLADIVNEYNTISIIQYIS